MTDPARRPSTLVPPPLPYFAAVAGGWWLDRHVLPLPLDSGLPGTLAGGALVLAGLALLAWTLLTFRRHHTTVNPYGRVATLCTSGPFALSRNPIYLGDWAILAGAALLLDTAWPLAFAPAVWALLRYGVIRHEEAHLEARFGDSYRAYRSRVRRWL